jgi:murein DD-endopeptidase MepM/ murein hydrolase activator NlpD
MVQQKNIRNKNAGVWLCRFLVLGAIWVYASSMWSIVAARRNAQSHAATAEADNAANGTGGAIYPAVEGSLLDNVSFESPLPAALEPEEFSFAQPVLYTGYKVRQNDYIGVLAQNFGLNQDTLISVNGIKNTRAIPEGMVLRVPNQDGILYTTGESDTLLGIAEKYDIEAQNILIVNELFSSNLKKGETLFLPGVKLDQTALQEINGDLFMWPTVNRFITSGYGNRRSPITGTRLFHNGIDIRGSTGAPVYAAMAGKVSFAGYNAVYGNYIVISHHAGYRTLYGHLNVIRVKSGAYVSAGQRIGDVGNTGASTGSHLHFTVYKNGVTVNPRVLTAG